MLTLFFETHFYPGTVINGVDVSCNTIKAADKKLIDRAASYVLILNERGNVKERMKGSEIGLKFEMNYGSLSLKNRQNRTGLAMSFFYREALNIRNAFTYDENLLRECYSKLSCVDNSKVIEPKNATLVYLDGDYKIVEEVYGNRANDTVLYPYIKSAVMSGKDELDLEMIQCYIDPTIKSDSKKVKDIKNMLGNYINSEIIYTYNGGREVVDKYEISNWIEIDGDLNVTFDRMKMKSFINTLADHYDTCGKIRDFVTSSGTRIKIGGGDYGWKVDVNGEITDLIQAIKKGETILKEPMYSEKGAINILNDIGLTYVEIDLSKQHLWYYKAGILIADGDVVSGKNSYGYKTPEGIYRLKFKVENAILRGEDYSSNVSYWMPFNNNIGIHDATWRTEFGRDIYLTRGSHGCINVTYSLAEKLYNNISVGTPIVCYYTGNDSE